VAGAEAYLRAKFHVDPSNRLATVHQRYRQTDRTRQDRQDNGPIAGRTVLQTVAQKLGKQDDLHVENKYETVNASLASEWTYACKICQGAARRFRFHGL